MGKQSAKFDTLLLAIDLLIMAMYCIITTYTDSEFSVSVFDGGYLWPLFRVGGIILAVAGVIAIFYSAYCGKQKCR